jgi:flagellar biogenesis protein FliO
MFETLFGAEISPALRFFIAFLVVLALIGATAWLVRRFGADRFGGATARGRQPRLAVVDAAAVDGRRRLVIIRRDNVEHLLMIGGPSDVVVETNIVRATAAPRDVPRETPTARTPVSDTLPRAVPLGESTMWPLQPQPEVPSRPQRATISEDPAQWTFQQPPQQPSRPPRPVDTLAGLAEELSGRAAPQRDSNHGANRTPSAPEPSRAAPAPERPQPEGGDQNLAEMAHRLEAALRGPAEPRRAAEASAKPESKSSATEPKAARTETRPTQPKSMYDSLEQEMASLLGRPPGKP